MLFRVRLRLDRAALQRAVAVAAVDIFQTPVDHRVDLAVFAVVGLSVTGEIEQAGHGLVLGVFVLLVHVGSSLSAGREAATLPPSRPRPAAAATSRTVSAHPLLPPLHATPTPPRPPPPRHSRPSPPPPPPPPTTTPPPPNTPR